MKYEQPKEPQLLQIMIDTFTNAYPKMAFGMPNYKMEPFQNLDASIVHGVSQESIKDVMSGRKIIHGKV